MEGDAEHIHLHIKKMSLWLGMWKKRLEMLEGVE